MSGPIRVAVLTSTVTPYRTPVFDSLAAKERIELSVAYLAETEPQRDWTTDLLSLRHGFVILPEMFKLGRRGMWVHFSRGLTRYLRSFRPHVVIAGAWDQPPMLLAYLLRRFLRFRFIWWVESSLEDVRSRVHLLRWLKGRLISGADGLIVPGEAARRYVLDLGAPPDRIVLAPNAVDNDRFQTSVNRPQSRGARFIFVGRFERAKGIDVLLDAWRGCSGCGTLTLIGEGSLRSHLTRRIEEQGLRGVTLKGHLDENELARAYSEADVLVLPSLSEPWGLVVNEGMAAGLPVIASTAVGAAPDLVEHGRTGLVVPPGDAEALAEAMRTLAVDPTERAVMGSRAAEKIKGFTPARCADGLVSAILLATQPRLGRLSS